MTTQVDALMKLADDYAGFAYSAPSAVIAQRSNSRVALRSAIVEALGQWRPIETAPKDGTEVLAWREDCGEFIASYTSAESFPMTQDEIDAIGEDALFAKDWFMQWPGASRLEGSEVPTAWMPLPAPPADALQQMEGERPCSQGAQQP